jgi:hypothetical protein
MLDNRIDTYYLRLSLEDGDVAEGNLEESCSITSQRLCVKQFLAAHPELGADFKEFADDGDIPVLIWSVRASSGF